MLSFDALWLFALLPAPLLLRRWLPPLERREAALPVPLLQTPGATAPPRVAARPDFAAACLWLFWALLLLAASRPYWLDEPVSRTTSGRDLMLAVDISGSMSEPDMTINGRSASRLEVLKLVADDFIARRGGDRIGLILFGTNAYAFVPLTFDLDTLRVLLDDVSTGLAGRRTAIGDAIGLAVKSLREQQARHKVLVLVTDGSNTAGFENPVTSALAARRQGLRIYTIGVGSDEETLRRNYGTRSIPEGTALDEPVLRRIAGVTGGRHFRATDRAALEQIYAELDRLEPVEHEFRSFRPRRELFVLPLALGVLPLAVYVVGSRRPAREPAA